jgi:hypothetical protein
MACDAAMRVIKHKDEETRLELKQDCLMDAKMTDKTLCDYPPLTSKAKDECRAKGIDPDDDPFARIFGGCPTFSPPNKPVEAAKAWATQTPAPNPFGEMLARDGIKVAPSPAK